MWTKALSFHHLSFIRPTLPPTTCNKKLLFCIHKGKPPTPCIQHHSPPPPPARPPFTWRQIETQPHGSGLETTASCGCSHMVCSSVGDNKWRWQKGWKRINNCLVKWDLKYSKRGSILFSDRQTLRLLNLFQYLLHPLRLCRFFWLLPNIYKYILEYNDDMCSLVEESSWCWMCWLLQIRALFTLYASILLPSQSRSVLFFRVEWVGPWQNRIILLLACL